MQRTGYGLYWRALGLLVVAVVVLGGAWGDARAQDGGTAQPATDDDTLTLLSADAELPVLFQALEPGAAVDAVRLKPAITLSAEERIDAPLVYVAIENTGWSQGAIGVLSEQLDANEDYIALEVRDRGMAGYAVREDGQGLAVALVYDAELGPDGEPGFRFDVVVGEIRMFRIFRVVEDNGLMLFAQQNTLINGARVQDRVLVTVDPVPVFGDLVLECHIKSLPDVVPEAGAVALPGGKPDADGDGVPDDADDCTQTWGTFPDGCVAG